MSLGVFSGSNLGAEIADRDEEFITQFSVVLQYYIITIAMAFNFYFI
jgi:hypothetical protein